MLEANIAQRWNNGGMWLQGSGAYNPDGGLGGAPGAQAYDHLFGSGRFAAGRHLAHRLRRRSSPTITAYMRFYDISYLDRLINDLFMEDDAGRSRFALTSYYFQGLRSTDVSRRIPYVAAAAGIISYIPMQKVAGRPVPLRPQRRRHRPRRPAQRPAPDQPR